MDRRVLGLRVQANDYFREIHRNQCSRFRDISTLAGETYLSDWSNSNCLHPRLGQPLWKNSDFDETADGKISLDDYDLTDLTIRVIDQMKKQSGMEPTPREVRERYAPWTLPKQANGEEKKNGEEKNKAAKKEVKAERQRDPRDLKLSADGKYYYPDDKQIRSEKNPCVGAPRFALFETWESERPTTKGKHEPDARVYMV